MGVTDRVVRVLGFDRCGVYSERGREKYMVFSQRRKRKENLHKRFIYLGVIDVYFWLI